MKNEIGLYDKKLRENEKTELQSGKIDEWTTGLKVRHVVCA